jgi:Tol biopolymer transport system component
VCIRALTRAAIVAGVAVVSTALPAAAEAPVPQEFVRQGLNSLVSIATDGTQGDANSADAQITPDGRFVVFFSDSSSLAPDDNGWGDVFIRDRLNGTTEKVSVAFDGGDADQMSMQGTISADGRYVTFISFAHNLTDETLTGLWGEVYHRDLETGITQRVTKNLTTGGSSSFGALSPAISRDGRYVAFHSASHDLVANDTNGWADIFVWDSTDGSMELVSTNAAGEQANDGSAWPWFSPDGRHIAFSSLASNLVGGDNNSSRDVFLKDLETGEIELVSVASDESLGNQNAFSPTLSFSDDGSLIAFQSLASNLVPMDTNGATNVNTGSDVFVRDVVAGTTERISLSNTGGEMVNALSPSISGDGRYVAFTALKPGADPSDFLAPADVWLHDRQTGSTELISATPSGIPSDDEAENPAITADGRFVFFQTRGSTFVPGDANELQDVVVRDRVTDFGIVKLGLKGISTNRSLAGNAAFPGVQLQSVADPVDVVGAPVGGAELTGASVSYRRTSADLLFDIELSDIPTAGVKLPDAVFGDTPAAGGSGTPGLLYGVSFVLNGTRWELRATQAGVGGGFPESPSFSRHACDPTCDVFGLALQGGFGTAGNVIRISLPAGNMGLQPGEVLEDVTAFTALGDTPAGSVMAIDEVALDPISLPNTSVQLGLGDPDAPADQIVFDLDDVFGGDFSFSLKDLAWQGKSLWTRACIADVCSPGTRFGD